MISVAQATELVFERALPLRPTSHELSGALGLVLAEDVSSDVDMPPYDKSLMDGYAVRSGDISGAGTKLDIIEEVMAGQVPRRTVSAGQATRLMTGAPIPGGADAVVPVERSRSISEEVVQIDAAAVRPWQHIMRRSAEICAGEVVLRNSTVIGPTEMGVLATVGRVEVQTYPRPVVAVVCTGDELVAPPAMPGPGQIRNGNGPMLLGQIARAGGVPRDLGIARDRPDSLKAHISAGLDADVLVLSGGVSAGKLDLVPGILQERGVRPLFHKVELKPGKPVFFGTYEQKLVFGLPGNPVSATVCFELFVRPALRRLAGHATAVAETVDAALTEDFRYRTDRPTYHPARLELTSNGWQVRAVPWQGSADLRSLLSANAYVLLLPDQDKHRAGARYTVLRTST